MQFVPFLRLPPTWPFPVIAAIAMSALAGLDLLGAYAAKQWVLTRSTGMAVTGVAAFLVLFWVYASALQYAELAIVTLGWIVVLQIGLLVLDRVAYGVHLSGGKWCAIVVILAAQAYLLLPEVGSQPPVTR